MALSNRTLCNDGNILYLHCPILQLLANVAIGHLICGWCNQGTGFFISINLIKIATCGLWLQYWTAQMWLLPTFLTSTHTIFSLNKKDSALEAFFLVSQAHKSASYRKAFAHVVPLCLEQFSCTLCINQHLNFHVILSVHGQDGLL